MNGNNKPVTKWTNDDGFMQVSRTGKGADINASSGLYHYDQASRTIINNNGVVARGVNSASEATAMIAGMQGGTYSRF